MINNFLKELFTSKSNYTYIDLISEFKRYRIDSGSDDVIILDESRFKSIIKDHKLSVAPISDIENNHDLIEKSKRIIRDDYTKIKSNKYRFEIIYWKRHPSKVIDFFNKLETDHDSYYEQDFHDICPYKYNGFLYKRNHSICIPYKSIWAVIPYKNLTELTYHKSTYIKYDNKRYIDFYTDTIFISWLKDNKVKILLNVTNT